eukprot:TRINITY_DN34386_c0_g1_i1.p1 TRINITY_DN34386_c0_g1~~TRINITY_DN34386_c0_g1_i1.p1  ORF type:complete len:727 (+),score=231.01 TRINITY_DN34386_c0_g1_i1:71-2182(+)
MVGETARKRERRQLSYAVRTGTAQRRPVPPEEAEELFRVIDRRDLARFGVRLLGTLELDQLHPAPPPQEGAGAGDERVTLLGYAALRGRDHFVAALLRTGADPGVLWGRQEGPADDGAARRYVSRLPRCYAVFVVRGVARMHLWAAAALARGDGAGNTCAACGRSPSASGLLWAACGHWVCEPCQWSWQAERGEGGDDELRCPAPGCGAVPPPLPAVAHRLRRRYGESRPGDRGECEAGEGELREAARAEDWACPLCGFENFARRAACRSCAQPRPGLPPPAARPEAGPPAASPQRPHLLGAGAAAGWVLAAALACGGRPGAAACACAAAAALAGLYGGGWRWGSRAAPRKERSLALWRELPDDAAAAGRAGLRNREPFRALDRAAAGGLWAGGHKQGRGEQWARAARGGDAWRLEALLEAGIDTELRDEYGHTALFVCAMLGHARAVRLLAACGADPSAAAHGGCTPIAAAAACGHQACVEALQAAGAGLSERASEGLSAGELLARGAPPPAAPPAAASLRWAVPLDAQHPGAGSCVVDGALSEPFLARLDALWRALPEARAREAKEGAHNVRSYYCDAEGWLRRELAAALRGTPCTALLPQMRFLVYDKESQSVPPHVDLSRTVPETGAPTTHSFIVYLTDNGAEAGGETTLLERLGKGDPEVLADIAPRRGRVLLFPHKCPHMARGVRRPPKLLLRGEAY